MNETFEHRAPRVELGGAALSDEARLDEQLRPRSLEEMVGQDRLRENLAVFIRAARERGEPLDHLLFHGPPGLGKTSLAHVVAHEMGAPLRATSGPAVERAGDLAALLSNLEDGDVLFIDEVHRLPPAVEEILYPAMEDFKLDILIGHGPGARSMRLDLPRFTLVGATTRAGRLSSPLRDRFGWVARLEYYPPADLERILARSARLLQIDLETGACAEIARRSRGTPRIANRLLRRVRDFAQVQGGVAAAQRGEAERRRAPAEQGGVAAAQRGEAERRRAPAEQGGVAAAQRGEAERRPAPARPDAGSSPSVGCELARFALERLEVDALGFDRLDRTLLLTLLEKFEGGPAGLETLAAAVGEDKGTLEDVVEPYLIYLGYLARTPRGRVATARSRQHFGIPQDPEPGGQPKLL
jgi:Holliday junction DNA helicase RuvB